MSLSFVVIVIYTIVATWLSVYGFYVLMLCLLYLYHRKDQIVLAELTEFPHVTVQLPIYNERYVVERLVDAAAALDWPHDKLHIQVLDDSTDETSALARARVELYRARGIDIVHLHRVDRTGYKAGALQAGLALSDSPYVAIFDADFCPAPDFLRRMIPGFIGRPNIGWVQARWTHLNEDYSPLTHALAVLVDAHFVLEQVARTRAGLPMIFNGSAGIWRRACIDAAGGWEHDTLTEDADLSYRAQIAGWRGMILEDVEVPSELPVQMAALKQQHFRWAKGGGQVMRKLFLPLLRSRLPFWFKLSGLVYITAYISHPLIIILLVTWLPIIFNPQWIARSVPLTFLSLGMFGLPLEFLISQAVKHKGDLRRLIYMPLLLVVGTGMAFNNARAVIQGLLGQQSEFMRTPKFKMEGVGETWRRSVYAMSADSTAFGEALMAGYATFMMVEAWRWGNLGAIPFLLLYALGFAYVALASAMDIGPRRKRPTIRVKVDAG